MPILRAFLAFPNEAALIGRMLAGYADLEIDLLHCAQVVRDDFDTVLKTMFRTRGETARINVADAFGRQAYTALGLATEFEQAIAAVRHCLKIRNQYAHCVWWDDNSGRLALANLEEVAKDNGPVPDLTGLTTRHVDVPHLQAQLDYFDYANALLVWVNYEGRTRAQKPSIPNQVMPAPLAPPPLYAA